MANDLKIRTLVSKYFRKIFTPYMPKSMYAGLLRCELTECITVGFLGGIFWRYLLWVYILKLYIQITPSCITWKTNPGFVWEVLNPI